jgi:adenylate kinase family enzyme
MNTNFNVWLLQHVTWFGFIAATEVIAESIKKRDENAKQIKAILTAGEAIPDEIVLELISEKIKSAEVAHQGT